MAADPAPLPMISNRWAAAAWRTEILAEMAAGAGFAGLLGTAQSAGCRVDAVLVHGETVRTTGFLVNPGPRGEPAYPALSPDVPAAFWYERALHDLFGVRPIGHPRLDPLLLAAPPGAVAPRPGGPDRPGRMHQRVTAGAADVAGRGVFSIPFGPVRSGVTESIEFLIEPPGEDIAHLNIRPHYKHRGVAKAFEGRTVDDGVPAGSPRRFVRFDVEIDTAATLIGAALADLGGRSGPLRRPVHPGTGTTLGWAEGPQGEELYSLELVDGRIRRCFARSASLHNLVLMHEVVHGDVLTDFPFIEASFGLCYAGVAM